MSAPNSDLKTALSGSESERLLAARQLRVEPQASLVEELKQARAREKVRWIRTALDEAIGACQGVQAPKSLHETVSEEDLDARQAYEDGRSDGLRQALHELSPIVGLARSASEDDDFEEVNRQLNRLRAVCAGLRGFVHASSPRQFGEFDLSDVPLSLAASPPIECPEGVVTAQGASPLMVRGDRDLLELALRPVVINAIEAVCTLGEPAANAVTISWGLEQDSCWVVVIDHGPGIDPRLDLLSAGLTTKPGHIGFGLATTQAAMDSLDGLVEVKANEHGGATVLLEWGGAS